MPTYTYDCPDGHTFDRRLSFKAAEEAQLCAQPPRGAGKPIRVGCCGDIIQSKNVHDMVRCGCGNFSIDGGSAYVKCSAAEPCDVEELTPEETFDARIKTCGKIATRRSVYDSQVAMFNGAGFTRSSTN